MAREMFGLSLGFAALILLTAHAHGAGGADLTRRSLLPTAIAATPPEAPR